MLNQIKTNMLRILNIIPPFTQSKNYLDHKLDCNLDQDPEDVHREFKFNTTKCITLLLFIVWSLLHHNPSHIWIKIMKIVIQIECLLNPDHYLDCDLDNFAPRERGIR